MIATSGPAAGEAPARNYLAMVSESPCVGCSAPCCRMVIFPHHRPQSYLDFDYLRYVLGFRSLEVLVHSDGEWSIAVLDSCRHLDEPTGRCTVHGTDRQPRVCLNYPGDACWYRRNFDGPFPANVIRINMETLDALLPLLVFDAEGRLVGVPGWDELARLAHPRVDVPIS